jgi:hypothetical protein
MLDRMHGSRPYPRRHGLVSRSERSSRLATGSCGYPDREAQSLRSQPVADTTSDTAPTAPSRLGAQLPTDLVLTPLVDGRAAQGRPVMEWLTTFHLASVVLDPYTNESSWVLKSAIRVLEQFRGSDARINVIVTANSNDARTFLGPYADRFLVFCDPDRAAVKAIGLSELPAFVFIRVDGVVAAAAQGWNPPEWEAVADAIAEVCWWTSIPVPGPGDPGPFRGSPALG